MPNSVDFRADQIQTKQIIVTGSGAGTTKLLIYGIEAQGSPVNEGEIDTNVFPQDGIGGDVFLYVSGALNAKGSATVRGTSVFGGDLVVSGSLYNGAVTAAGGNYSHAEGNSTIASGDYSHAEGESTIASGSHSHTEGQNTLTTDTGIYAHAEGYLTTAAAYAAHSEGDTTKAQTNGSHAEGHNSYTFDLGFGGQNGYYAHVEGSGSSACGDASHAEGYRTAASGAYSHAEGYQTRTTERYSHAEGYNTVVFGEGAHSEGHNTRADASGSHSEGYFTKAYGPYSHAEGLQTETYGIASHAEGENTKTFGDYSHAEGYYTIASGSHSHAGGQRTIASGSYQTVVGNYNKRLNTTSLFVIGNGTGNSNALRGDIFRAESTGELVLSGGIRHKAKYEVSDNSNVTLTKSDYLVIVNTADYARNVYLPEITDLVSDIGLTVKIIKDGTNVITIYPSIANLTFEINAFDLATATLQLPTGLFTMKSYTLTFMGYLSSKGRWFLTDASYV
jgi:hypothetical protein